MISTESFLLQRLANGPLPHHYFAPNPQKGGSPPKPARVKSTTSKDSIAGSSATTPTWSFVASSAACNARPLNRSLTAPGSSAQEHPVLRRRGPMGRRCDLDGVVAPCPQGSWGIRGRLGPRSRRFPQEGDRELRGRATVVRTTGQGRELSSRRLPCLLHPTRHPPGRSPTLSAAGMGRGPPAARRATFPRPSFFKRNGRSLWSSGNGADRGCPIGGSSATMNWADRRNFGQICVRVVSGTSWTSRATPRSAIWSDVGPHVGEPASVESVRPPSFVPMNGRPAERIPLGPPGGADGAKGPLEVEAMSVRVKAKHERRIGPEERLIVVRTVEADPRVDYALSNAPPEVGLSELAGVRAHRFWIEAAMESSKGEAGLDHYEVRSWVGWHHHMTLSLLASWFLELERTRVGGEKHRR